MRTLSQQTARRLAVASQQLAGRRPAATRAAMRDVLRAIRVVQLDPIRAVERTQRLVLFSRLGPYDVADLNALRGEERFLFEYWAHAASLVLSDDLPLFLSYMHHVRDGGWRERTRNWLAKNSAVRAHIRDKLAADGPLPSKAIKEIGEVVQWVSTGWTNNRNTIQMLDCMWTEGEVLVARREKNTRYWALAHDVLPQIAETAPLSRQEAATTALELALRALGVATARHLRDHFTRNRFVKEERQALQRLLNEGRIHQVAIADLPGAVAEDWYIHDASLALLDGDALTAQWQPRTTLLSPFDNLICDRARTEQLFDFHYRIEIYVPRAKRKYGYYVLPILHSERLIGRIDPKMDRKTGRLHVHQLYPEADCTADDATIAAVGEAIGELAAFLGAREVVYEALPQAWRALPALTPRCG